MRHFLSMSDLDAATIDALFGLTKRLKTEATSGTVRTTLATKTLVMLFEKPSLRTKLSFDIGITQLGGHALYLGPQEVGLGKRESAEDIARVISDMGDMMVARVFHHETLLALVHSAGVPVINGLSDFEHPCQTLADLYTVLELKHVLRGVSVAFVGDAENNVVHSLALGCALVGMHVRVSNPRGYALNQGILKKALAICRKTGGSVRQIVNPRDAVSGADVVYTDTWISMGDERESEVRQRTFRPYQVTSELLSGAKPDAIFMHDLPAHRGREVTAQVIDGAQSVVFEQAENRLHVQKALMLWLSGHV